MAKFMEVNQESFDGWVNERPQCIQEMIKKYPPNLLYLLKTTNQRVTLYSYHEDGTVTINVTGEYNKITFSRRVFGIDPKDLEECDFPEEGEELGVTFIEREEVEEFLENFKKRETL